MGLENAVKRLEGWEARLGALIEEARTRPFAWGTQDCCAFACAAVEAITGQDFYKDFRGRVNGQRDALRALEPFGGVEQAFTRYAGTPVQGWEGARRGDVVLLPIGPCGNAGRDGRGGWIGPALAVVDLSGLRACAPGMAGLSFVPVRSAVRHWVV